jgi:hypothetical protein
MSNRKWHLGMLIAALAIAVIFGFRLRHQHRPAVAKLPAPSEVPAPPQIPPVAPTTPIRTPPTSTAPHADKSIELCGVGTVPVDGPGAAKAGADLDARAAKDMLRWRSALLNSSDVRARAVGLFIESRFDGNFLRTTALQQPLDSLVTLAEETKDPAVYAVALSACNNIGAPTLAGNCEGISLKGWTKLEGENAAPWLELAGYARVVNDVVNENAAFAQAANAARVDAYSWSLFGFAEADIPSDVTPLERYELSIQMMGIETAMYSPQTPTVSASKHCSADGVRNELVRSQCSRLAELFVTKGTTVLDLIVGTSIGARIGWSQARVAALKEEKEALEAVGMQAEPDPAKPDSAFSCEASVRRNHYLHERAQLGEIAAAREAIGLSGRTNAELAQIYREYLDKLMRSAPPAQSN